VKKLGVLLIILAICLPAYSQVLVYSVSYNLRGVAGPALEGTDLETGKEKFRGYLVCDVDLSAADPCMALIVYSRDDIGAKVYEKMVLHVEEFYGVAAHPYACALGIVYGEGDARAILTGNVKAINIGASSKGFAARSLKGYIIIHRTLPLTENEGFGSGVIKAKLNLSRTKEYNREKLSFERAVHEVIDELEDSGYAPYQSPII
jgi:hypothetical protein